MMQKGSGSEATWWYIEGPCGSQREGPPAIDFSCALPSADIASNWADDARVSGGIDVLQIPLAQIPEPP